MMNYLSLTMLGTINRTPKSGLCTFAERLSRQVPGFQYAEAAPDFEL